MSSSPEGAMRVVRSVWTTVSAKDGIDGMSARTLSVL
jgi:hypothetical protein